jgi:hypothetical protein
MVLSLFVMLDIRRTAPRKDFEYFPLSWNGGRRLLQNVAPAMGFPAERTRCIEPAVP